jgi:2-C-methyl-D-erythritol 4-phosphate cytidylyltransferase
MEILAILVAAGRGERLGADRPKAFVELGGKPLLLWAAEAFEAHPAVEAIVAVVPEAQHVLAREKLRQVTKLTAVVPGGERRQDSVEAGLRAAPAGFDGLVLVHDAARPFVEARVIGAVIDAAREGGAALPVVPVVDTLKRVRAGCVVETLDRSELFGAQTPQGFRLELLRRAYDAAAADGWTVTDEAMALERSGRSVRTVPGSPLNRKITTADDLAWGEDVLRRGGLR